MIMSALQINHSTFDTQRAHSHSALMDVRDATRAARGAVSHLVESAYRDMRVTVMSKPNIQKQMQHANEK